MTGSFLSAKFCGGGGKKQVPRARKKALGMTRILFLNRKFVHDNDKMFLECEILRCDATFFFFARSFQGTPVKKGAAGAAPVITATLPYIFSTCSLLSTLKAPGICPAFIPASCLSIALSTAP
jgi:hypothetical protein